MLQSEPVEMKRIGRKVALENVDRKKQWLQSKGRNVMKTAENLKFSQNHALCDELKKTAETFVEANQYDRTWGVGLAISDKGVLNPAEWKGSHWLGVIATEVRDELLKIDKKM